MKSKLSKWGQSTQCEQLAQIRFRFFLFAVVPQVRVAFTGIAIYTWDVAFRAATVVGFFGGGGMGWYLKQNVQQLENLRVGAIILLLYY